MGEESMAGAGAGAGYGSGSVVGYRCEACGNDEVFKALKPYWYKVEVNASGMVLETHGIQCDGEELEEVECGRCEADCGPFEKPTWKPSRYRCLTCGNERDFHRYYVEEAKELLTEDGEWEILKAWGFDDGAYTTYGAICTPCTTAGRDDDVVEVQIVEVKETRASEAVTSTEMGTEENQSDYGYYK